MQTVLSATLMLFLVMDPIGNIPVFLSVLRKVEPQRQSRVIFRELLIALAVLVLFLFTGRYILKFLGITEPSLSIAGGIILFLIAIRMIFPESNEAPGAGPNEEPFIVPLAIPLIAGPSAMTAVLLLMAQEPWRWAEWLVALVSAWFVSGVILLLSSTICNFLGTPTLTALERLMGMLLTTLAVEMFIKGVSNLAFIHR